MHEHQSFYEGLEWRECRKAYLKSVNGLCENCLKRGLYNPARVVHHKIHIDEQTVSDPEVALSWENLEALCQDCHAEMHRDPAKRFVVDEKGEIVRPPFGISREVRKSSARVLTFDADKI